MRWDYTERLKDEIARRRSHVDSLAGRLPPDATHLVDAIASLRRAEQRLEYET